MIRKIVKSQIPIIKNNVRLLSSQENLIDIKVNDQTGIATLTLNRPPVNSLNLELLTSISNGLDEIMENRSKGMILTSSSKTVFSAGLDITEMYKPKMERLRDFWSTLQDVWSKLYGSPFPTAAAINGHAPAGGCLLSLCCEYRVMCPNFTIGLNETQLGIVAPTWFQSTMNNVLPRRQTEMALTLGRMFTTDEALKIGLIDETANDKIEAIAKCETFIKRFDKVPRMARAITKQVYRSKDIQELENNKEQDIDLFVTAVTDKKVQQSLGVYMEALKNKSKSN